MSSDAPGSPKQSLPVSGEPQQILTPGPPQQILTPGPPQQILTPGPPQQILTPGPPQQILTPGPPQQILTPGGAGTPPSQPPTAWLPNMKPPGPIRRIIDPWIWALSSICLWYWLLSAIFHKAIGFDLLPCPGWLWIIPILAWVYLFACTVRNYAALAIALFLLPCCCFFYPIILIFQLFKSIPHVTKIIGTFVLPLFSPVTAVVAFVLMLLVWWYILNVETISTHWVVYVEVFLNMLFLSVRYDGPVIHFVHVSPSLS